jgi:hydroxymethylbilane synthase
LRVEDIRGNVDSRLAKLDGGQYDAIILAEAGLKRLGLTERTVNVIPRSVMLPAVGQGALGIECRADDSTTRQLLSPLDDAVTHACVLAERALLLALRGGCLAPVGALGRIENGRLQLNAVVLPGDGSKRIAATGEADPGDAVSLGQRVAQLLLDQGAAELIAASRGGERDPAVP